ncbi:MAG TPA: tetratricopeptide repeat protein [Chitinophagaceae bacterium]
MKRIIFAGLFTGLAIVSTGQNKVDSLLNDLSRPQADSNRVFTYLWICNSLMENFPDSAFLYAQKGLQLAKSIQFKKGQAQSLSFIGTYYNSQSRYAQAFETYVEALKLHEEMQNMRGIAAAYNNLGLIHQDQRDYNQALEKFMKTKELQGALYEDELVTLLLNIGNNYEKIDKLDSALVFQQQAYALATKIKDSLNIGTILINLGNIQFKLNHYQLAMSHYKEAIPYTIAAKQRSTLSDAYYGIAKAFEMQNQPDSVIAYSKKALELAKEVRAYPQMNKSATLLFTLYQKNKKIDSAFVYQSLAMHARDNLFNSDTVRMVQTQSIREKLRQEERAISLEKEKHDRKINLQYLAISIFIISFFGILYYLSKWKYKPRIVKHIGLVGLLMTFEFISIFLHPYVGSFTHHEPIFMLLIFVTIASLLVPVHHKLEHWVEEKLTPKKKRGPKKGSKKAVIKKPSKEETELIEDADLTTASEVQ